MVMKKLFSNSFYLFLEWFFLTFSSLIFWLLAAKFLPPKDYGNVLIILNSSLILAAFLSGGLGLFLPKMVAKRNFKEIKISIVWSIISFIITLLIFLFSFPFILRFLKLEFFEIRTIFLISIFIALSNIFGFILYGLQLIRIYFISSFYSNLFKVALPFILIFVLGINSIVFTITFFVSFFILFLIRFLLSLRFLKFKLSLPNLKGFKNFQKFLISSYLIFLTSFIISNGQPILLNIFNSRELAGIYGLSLTISSLIFVFPSILSRSFFPIFSSKIFNIKKEGKILEGALRYSIILALPLLFILIIFSKEIIILFSSFSYLPSSFFIPIISFSFLFFGISNIFLLSLYAKEKLYEATISSLIPFSFFLFIYFYFKTAISLTISFLFFSIFRLFFSYIFASKIFSLNISSISEKALKPSIPIILNFFIFYFIYHISQFFYLKIILPILFVLTLLFLFKKFKVFSKEDESVLNYLAMKFPFLKKQILSLKKIISN